MRIVAITRILDEADIVEAFVRHAAHFVDHHIIMDNGSRDGTFEILKQLHAEGFPITIYQTPAISFRESDQLTGLFKEAVLQHGADWVACLDADEFYDDSRLGGVIDAHTGGGSPRSAPGVGMRSYLEAIDRSGRNVVAIRAAWVHYNYTRKDDTSNNVLPRRITHRNKDYNDYKAIISKRLIAENGRIHNGSHDAWVPPGSSGESVIEPSLWVCHFGERSPAQYVSKVVRGWSKVLAAGPAVVAEGHAGHYRGPFEILRDRPHELLRAEWFLKHKNEGPHLVEDPMPYHGGDLRYTGPNDPEMQAFRALVGHLGEICSRYGRMIEEVPGAREFSDRTDNEVQRIT